VRKNLGVDRCNDDAEGCDVEAEPRLDDPDVVVYGMADDDDRSKVAEAVVLQE